MSDLMPSVGLIVHYCEVILSKHLYLHLSTVKVLKFYSNFVSDLVILNSC